MAKKSKQRGAARYAKNQGGCMWGLISMFDFRHVNTTQKLLPERKRGSRRVMGATPKLDLLEDSSEILEEINGVEQGESGSVDASKMSVKELMEEEMVGDEYQKKQEASAELDPRPAAAVRGFRSHTRRNRRWKGKKSFDVGDADLFAAEDLVSEKHAHQKHRFSKSLDLSMMMEELCSQIHDKDIPCFKHDYEAELQTRLDQDSSSLERKLGEATKVFVDHFTDEKSFRKDGKIQPSKDLLEALQILNSNKEVFLKLVQDPNSLCMQHMQKLQECQVEKDRTSSEFFEDLGIGKHESFFWRKFKGLERSFSKRNDNPQDLNRIVVLKPGPPDSESLETAAAHNSLPQSPQETGNNVSSNFSFTELRRKLKHAMKKEQHPNPVNVDKASKTVAEENGGSPLPGRDHFFMERKPKSSSSMKRGDKIGRPKEINVQMEYDSAFATDQRVSNIYVEAKKHLAEIVGSSDADLDLSSRKIPKSLGRILAFPDYNSPVGSPRKEGDFCSPVAHARLSPHSKSQAGHENTCNQVQETSVNHPNPVKKVTEGNLCATAENGIVIPGSGEDASAENDNSLSCDEGLSREFVAAGDDSYSEVDLKEARSSETTVQGLSENLDISLERCGLSTNDEVESSEEKGQCTSSELGTVADDEISSSSMTYLSEVWHAKEVECLDTTADRAGQPSPISVLDPIFREDDISPLGIKSVPVGESIKPHRIQFEEQISPSPQLVAYIKTCGEYKKSIFEFIQVVVQKSGLTWNELLRRFLLSDHILEPALFDEVESLQDRLCEDPKLLFDLIDEVLLDICWHYFGSIFTFANPCIRPELRGKDVISEVWEIVDWYFELHGPRTLDQVLSTDYSRSRKWTDLRLDRGSIGIEMEEIIFDELMEDAILSLIDGGQGIEFAALPFDTEEDETLIES